MTNYQNESIDYNYKWGEIKLEKLSKEIDLKRLKQLKPILADEPLLPNILSSDLNLFNRSFQQKLFESQNQNEENAEKLKIEPKKAYRLKPSVDSYIINTIKLNELLKNKVSFDQIKFFIKPKKKKKKQSIEAKQKSAIIKNDDEARFYLKQFIIIMSIHAGFNEISSFALDTLTDVLDHYLESFFKLFKNLSQIHQSDLNSKEPQQIHNYYSSEHYIEQALEESGVGSIKDIKEFYINDIVLYFRDTYKKVSRLYNEYKAKKNLEKMSEDGHNMALDSDMPTLKAEHDVHLEEFMRDNDFLNDESNEILGELLTDLNVSHLDEEMNKLLSMIGHDPFSLINEFPPNSENEVQE